jgi:nucleoid DNA-binding protein
MTKRELAVKISRDTGMIQQDVAAIIQKTLDYITAELAEGGRVEFRDFGIFDVCVRKQRIGRNPNQPEKPVVIPEHNVARFRPGKLMKEAVSKR